MKEVSFYIFSLPFYLLILSFLISCVVMTSILVLLDYMKSYLKYLFKPAEINQGIPDLKIPIAPTFDFKALFSKTKMITHLGILMSLFFVLLAFKHYLARFSIMHSAQGMVVGAGYSDVMAYLPMIKIMMFLAIIIAALFLMRVFTSPLILSHPPPTLHAPAPLSHFFCWYCYIL